MRGFSIGVTGAAIALASQLSLPAWAGGDFDALSADEQARVDQGEIVVHAEHTRHPLKRLLVVGQIQASAAAVYHAYTDYEHYAQIFGLKSSKVLQRDGNTLDVNVTMDFPWPIGERWVTNETDLQPDRYAFTYHRIDGSIKEYVGEIKVVPLGEHRCQVYYTAKVDPGIAFLPYWLIDRLSATAFPDSIRDVRLYLKQHPED